MIWQYYDLYDIINVFDASCSNRIEKVETGILYLKERVLSFNKRRYINERCNKSWWKAIFCQAISFFVLMLDSKVGNPYLEGATVLGEVLKNGKQRKIRIFKYKSKDRSNRKTQGHRQPYTKIRITKING